MEEQFRGKAKALLTEVGAKNASLICGFEHKEKKTTAFELDFLFILGNQKTIIQVEAKVGLNEGQRTKVKQQFQNGLSFFKKMTHFQPGDGWSYLKVIYTEAISPDAKICDKCKPFVLDRTKNLIVWWNSVISGLSKGTSRTI